MFILRFFVFTLVLWLKLVSCGANTWFVYKPRNPLDVSEGSSVTFKWEFSSPLQPVLSQWTVYEDDGGFVLIAQRSGGLSSPVQYTKRLQGRVKVEETASLRVDDIKMSDAARYGCNITFEGGEKLSNITRLIVHSAEADSGRHERHLYWLFVGLLFLLVLLVIIYLYLQRRRRKMIASRMKQQSYPPRSLNLDAIEDDYHGPGSGVEYQVIPPIAPANSLKIREYPRDSVVVVKVIGKGAFGLVAKGIVQLSGKNEGSVVALKMLRKNATEDDHKDFMAELELMKSLEHHANVIALYGYVTESEPEMMIIEFVAHGDLLGYLRKSRGLQDTYFDDPDLAPVSSLTTQQLFTYAWHVANGMEFLASKKVIHRDLAARNVLVGEGQMCKITDFGLARNVHNDNIYTRTSRGRLPVKWTAYESLLYGTCTTMSDVWSYGVVLYEIFTIGGSPYPGKDGKAVVELLQDGYRMPKPDHLNESLYEVMTDCWQEKPDLRPNFTELRQRIKEMMDAGHDEYIRLEEYDAKLYENLDDLDV